MYKIFEQTQQLIIIFHLQDIEDIDSLIEEVWGHQKPVLEPQPATLTRIGRKMYGGGKPQCNSPEILSDSEDAQSSTEPTRNRFSFAHRKYPTPLISKTVTYTTPNDMLKLSNPMNCQFIPPKTQLRELMTTLQKEKEGQIVVLDYGQYDLAGLIKVSNICQDKEITCEVDKEIEWFSSPVHPEGQFVCDLNMDTIHEFKNLLFHNPCDTQIQFNDRIKVHVNDLKCLACERWINDEIIQIFLELINADSNLNTYVVNYNRIKDIHKLAEDLKMRIHIMTAQCFAPSH